ncbi:TonB-dependent receptor domain-containing protein [Erythrobacter sp. YT30]|uniref:TonB-dependent receptor domain-containing protein n=1 Tax=Erythrobacter sp. YT30 TaxID=1735012 RepID=UPI00076DBEEB|nr:TonB-dependent receptor [Erythrobacter sp. YT30]KWV90608.1 TonB-dependent receptor [Erythrobacter sp. YT30]
MKKFHSNSMKALAFSASAIAFVVAGPVYAQDEEPEAQEQEEEEGEEEQVNVGTDASGSTSGGQITVTGSRIVRDTYTSISPLQVLTTENQQAVGAFDPAQILQRSEAAAGTQIDATFLGFVLDNGPGSQTINLRGLGADRTLVLVNGRRLAPGGVGGAPTSPSINLIPSTLVDRYDLLLDGASSVYGSDAVAGVANIILRKDFDGLELQANGNVNTQGGGDDFIVSAAWGFNTDRAVFGIGAEYSFRDEIALKDRDFLADDTVNVEVDEDGNRFTTGLRDNAIVRNRTPGVTVSERDAIIDGISGRIFIPGTFLGSVYFPANGNIANIPGLNFGESTNAFGQDLDTDGDGVRDVDFQNVNLNGANLDQTFVPEQELINVFAYGEYTFPGEANITPFFEAQYTRADIVSPNSNIPQIFPFVPADNVFNPCNIASPNGTDCFAADNALLGGLFNPGSGSISTLPIASIAGDRNNFDVTQEQYRGVLGVRGDLPFIGSSWTFEIAGVYSRAEGRNSVSGIREDRLALALGIDPTADFNGDGIVDNNGDGIADDYNQNIAIGSGSPLSITPCDASALANPSLAAPGLLDGCTAVDLFNQSVLGAPIGDFATAAERDYVFDQSVFDTTYEQIFISGFVTGDLFDLPAGPVGLVVGAEWREDSIDSTPDFITSNGLFFARSSDAGATGSAWIREVFGELDVPLVAGETLVEELNVKLSGRITDQEFYGTNGTFSIGGGWRPVSPLLLKFNYGTSFRAPNLRENFLANQTGFLTITDPCAVPDAAFVTPPGAPAGTLPSYQANLDTRDPQTLANCLREGRDPTMVGIDDLGQNTFRTPSPEVVSGGTLDLDPETSTSITTGFAFEESFASGFEFSFNFNYYDIQIRDAIVEPGVQFIVNDCFTRQDGIRSPFCDRIGTDPTGRMLVSDVFQGFLNFNEEAVRGIDLNATFAKDVLIGGETFDLSLELRANHLIERSILFIDAEGNLTENNLAGEFGFPSWTGRATFFVDWEDFRFTWQTRYIGDVEEDESAIDEFDDAFGNRGTGFFSDTCLGDGTANVAGDGRFCRNVGFVDEWFEHTASVRWDNDTIRIIAGVTNIFDRAPPQVDDEAFVTSISNVPLGNGYNIDGREFFAQILYRF